MRGGQEVGREGGREGKRERMRGVIWVLRAGSKGKGSLCLFRSSGGRREAITCSVIRKLSLTSCVNDEKSEQLFKSLQVGSLPCLP